jgi:hypothetical protein
VNVAVLNTPQVNPDQPRQGRSIRQGMPVTVGGNVRRGMRSIHSPADLRLE